ncbi:lymphoid enhancer-binding factor 1-like [Gambusia affinis]|uniref:lymphoid enhancer-binding factor 1-like n=1 Tax=Gambusia affinis TaxID=33528 RepID=UPI001CDC5ACE|nr:lymphoid enhancer-binding factor 1-like [Gambusia affinis]
MPQLSGGGGDPELCATDEMIPFKDEGDPHKEQIFAELSHSEEEGDLADIKSSLVNESEISPNSNSHDAARQSQIGPDSYHEKHREHPDDDTAPETAGTHGLTLQVIVPPFCSSSFKTKHWPSLFVSACAGLCPPLTLV